MNLRAAADGRAEWVGFSRWLNNSNVTTDEIALHCEEVLSDRVAGLHVLAIQDTTELNYARHAGRVRGLGASGNGRDPGLFVHPVLAIMQATKPCSDWPECRSGRARGQHPPITVA